MQSKRFGPDRLPVVPPPELPPKRPPRRKTLANLDLNRESVTVNGDEKSQVDSPAPPPTPKSASHNNSISVDLEMSKSATLRSSTSDGRKRRNSVGRLAASAASRISRALSIKNLNSSDAASVTTAEAAPLLQQEAPKTTTAAPAQTTPSPSTHKTMTIKKDLGQLMRRMDPRPVIDRILAPKTPSAEEGNKNKPLPERPPLPTTAAKVAPKERKEKPIIKNGKVQFQCQKCEHQWSSAKGTARFEILMNEVGEGIRRGEVLVRLYGQRCNHCLAEGFEKADWTEEGIEKSLTSLRSDVSRRFYPADLLACNERGPKAHQSQLCQACQEGVCQRKSTR